jgi:hypothetical protein
MMTRREEQERKRIAELERQLIQELKKNLFDIMNENAKISDVREADVKEIEIID